MAKVAGEAHLNQSNGQIESVFRNTPQVPFEDLTLHLFDGPQASQSTPPFCGTYTTTSAFTAWAQEPGGPPRPDATPSGNFEINKGPNGEACTPQGSPRPPNPSFAASSTITPPRAYTD